MPKAGHCTSCRLPWIEHLGIIGTCKKLKAARTALQIINTWATFQQGQELNPKHVENLCQKALKESDPNAP